MRKLLHFLLWKPVKWASAKFASRPRRDRVFAALSKLYARIQKYPGRRGPLLTCGTDTARFIIFSDQHKGRRNGADDFAPAETNYLSALQHYHQENFFFINLGDSEELWENNFRQVRKANQACFAAENNFLLSDRYIKVFGNHDLYWDNDPRAIFSIRSIHTRKLHVYEGVVLRLEKGQHPLEISDNKKKANPLPAPFLTVLLTHGHQGDASSDGNWFSKFFVANIWAPLQSLLRINPNTPAWDLEKKTLHNSMMYEWSAEQRELVLITGHTHQPVFGSLTQLERLYKKYQLAEKAGDITAVDAIRAAIRKVEKNFAAVAVDYMTMQPTYYNTGCCCYNDGDITGIEIADGEIRLIKWTRENGVSKRVELEKTALSNLL